MPNLAALFPLILATHIALAVSLLVPSLLLPFTLRGRRRSETNGRVVRALLWLQSNGTVVIGAGLAAAGIAMIVQRPNLRRLLMRSGPADDAAERRWRDRARRQRYVAYAMAAAVGLIAFLMSTKPALW